MDIQFGKRVTLDMRAYTKFCSDLIGLNGDVVINLCKDTLDGGSYGLCWGDVRPVEIIISSRSDDYFLTQEDILRTLGHELVHAKQYLSGNLIPPVDPAGFDTWKGVVYEYAPEEEINMPWEIEATYLEQEIYSRYITRQQHCE